MLEELRARLKPAGHSGPAKAVEIGASGPRADGAGPFGRAGTDVCASAVDGTVLYQDATHLSVEGSLRLSPSLRQSLLEVLDVSTASR